MLHWPVSWHGQSPGGPCCQCDRSTRDFQSILTFRIVSRRGATQRARGTRSDALWPRHIFSNEHQVYSSGAQAPQAISDSRPTTCVRNYFTAESKCLTEECFTTSMPGLECLLVSGLRRERSESDRGRYSARPACGIGLQLLRCVPFELLIEFEFCLFKTELELCLCTDPNRPSTGLQPSLRSTVPASLPILATS